MLLHRARATMAAFLTSMQASIMIEVLEAGWTAFAHKLDACPNLDDLIGVIQKMLCAGESRHRGYPAALAQQCAFKSMLKPKPQQPVASQS